MTNNTSTVSDATWAGGLVRLTHCGECNALYDLRDPCPVCGHVIDLSPQRVKIDDVEVMLPATTQGAIPWSAHVLLNQMRMEWRRPLLEQGNAFGSSQRLVIVVLFWSLFEVLTDRFYEAALADLPGLLDKELLNRFSSIGSRLDRLHRAVWGTTFWDDLVTAGYPEAATHLKLVQERRNAFVHGDPEAINDALVDATMEHLLEVQLGWVAVFNKRCTGIKRKVPIWQADLKSRQK